ncbi:MAG: hypothetical protein GY898_16670 [Proteobacteria bacterium]|nr:hypothetical protein [Pseudomonadota bacterium]
MAASARADEQDEEASEHDEDCSLEVGDFDAEQAPLCSGSCTWADVAPAAVVEILSKPGRWQRHFRPLVEGTILGDGRFLQVYKAKPFARRQVTVELEVDSSGEGYRVSWRKSAKQEPLEEDRVEVETYDGWWEVRPDGHGGSVVTHAARFDPGPGIPRKFIRKGMPMQIRRLLRQLRKAVDEGDP